MMVSSPRSSIHNQKAKLAADYNDLLKQLASPKITVIGCYNIGKTIGEGTYGKVKLGTHQITGKRVAIKKISKQHAPLMAREIHHHRQLRHPNIVTLYEVLSTESAIFIVCEYCPNGDLFDLLARTGRFTEDLARLYFRQLVDAVRYCHERNIVHRDLKPENILLDVDQGPKICDFGFARHAEDRQLLETFCGSLAYSAPEIISQKKYTGPGTDIWSLGVILYTLLAGELPFDDDSELVMRRKIVALDYELPSYFSPDAQDLVDSILQLDPKQRLTMNQIMRHPWMSIDNEYNSVSSPRCSIYSDVDSAFSRPTSRDDDYDTFSDASSCPGTPKHASWNRNSRQILMPIQEKSCFSPTRPPRYSAPTVSSRARVTQPHQYQSIRSSLPINLPSSKLGRRSMMYEEPTMGPMEERLFSALTAAGFDESTVQKMYMSDSCNALGAMWHMLMDNLHKQTQIRDATLTSNAHVSIGIQTDPVAIEAVVPHDMDCSVESESCPPRPSQQQHQQQPLPQQQIQIQAKAKPNLNTASTNSSGTVNGKSGWFTSVKSWFGSKQGEGATTSPHPPYMLPLQQAPIPFSPPELARPVAAHNKPSHDSYYKASNAFGPSRSMYVTSVDTMSPVATPKPVAAELNVSIEKQSHPHHEKPVVTGSSASNISDSSTTEEEEDSISSSSSLTSLEDEDEQQIIVEHAKPPRPMVQEQPQSETRLAPPVPAPYPTRSWPLAFRENNSTAPRRYEFSAPRSQLGTYNDGGCRKPMATRAIIEEEEEEE